MLLEVDASPPSSAATGASSAAPSPSWSPTTRSSGSAWPRSRCTASVHPPVPHRGPDHRPDLGRDLRRHLPAVRVRRQAVAAVGHPGRRRRPVRADVVLLRDDPRRRRPHSASRCRCSRRATSTARCSSATTRTCGCSSTSTTPTTSVGTTTSRRACTTRTSCSRSSRSPSCGRRAGSSGCGSCAASPACSPCRA